jgi:ATP/maltotriose-dependent transcriptional regulator MalT
MDPAPALVGRDEELGVLTGLIDEVLDTGTARMATVSGEAGIGKTYLLAELARRAADDGWIVLTGSSSEYEREVPFGVLINALDAHLASLDPRTWEEVAPADMTELGGIFPSLHPLAPETLEPATASERNRAFYAIRDLIARLAAMRPVLVICDDLHWADDASIEHIEYLLRSPPEAPVMAVGGFRTGSAESALAAAFDAAGAAGALVQLEVGPLSPAEAEELLGREEPELYEETGGNPFYLLQLVGRTRAPGATSVPAAVGQVIAEQLAGLSAGGRGIVEAAAVVGDPFALDLAAETAGVDGAAADAAIGELTERDLVHANESDGTFRFRHPLVRSAVYERTAPGARLAAHERAAAALVARGAPASARARHLEHAAHHGDLGALAVLRDAGLEAAGRAPAIAARWFATALRVLPRDAPDSERLELLAAVASARAAIGELEDAHAALLDALAVAPEEGPVSRVRLVSKLAGVEQVLGRHDEAQQRLLAAVEELADPESVVGAELTVELAFTAFHRVEYERMREWALRALDWSHAAGEPLLAATAGALAALACVSTGAIEEAQRLRAEAAAIVDPLPDDAVAARPHALQWLSAVELFLDRFDDGSRHSERGLELARHAGLGELVPGLTQSLGNVLLATGRLAEAAERLEGAVDAARLTDNALGLAWTLTNRATVATAAGEIEAAVAAAEEAVVLATQLEGGYVATRAGTALGAALHEAGEHDRAVTAVLEATGGEDMPRMPAAWRPAWQEVLTRARLQAGDSADAERSAANASDAAAALGLPLPAALAKRARAAVALGAGDFQRAAGDALASAQAARDVGAPVDAALAQTLAGRALAALGERDRAVELLTEAATALDGCGAQRHRDRAELELGKLGRRAHRRTRRGVADSGVAALTGRELEVARLLAQRKTNPQIASELFLSVKTVETHVRNVFRKLNVSSRVDAARIVERED